MTEVELVYLEHEQILFLSWAGATTTLQVENMWLDLISKGAIPNKCSRFLIDQRKVTLVKPISKLKQTVSIYTEYPEIFAQAKIAVLIDKPSETARFQLIKQNVEGVTLDYFITEKVAKAWLKQPL